VTYWVSRHGKLSDSKPQWDSELHFVHLLKVGELNKLPVLY